MKYMISKDYLVVYIVIKGNRVTSMKYMIISSVYCNKRKSCYI